MHASTDKRPCVWRSCIFERSNIAKIYSSRAFYLSKINAYMCVCEYIYYVHVYMDVCVCVCVCVSIRFMCGGSLCEFLLSSEFNIVGFVQLGCSLLEGGGSGSAGYQVPQALTLLLQ